jgi:hypothetical protein
VHTVDLSLLLQEQLLQQRQQHQSVAALLDDCSSSSYSEDNDGVEHSVAFWNDWDDDDKDDDTSPTSNSNAGNRSEQQVAKDIVERGLIQPWSGVLSGVRALDQVWGLDHGLLLVNDVNDGAQAAIGASNGFGWQDGIWRHTE